MVSTRRLISKSSSICTNPLVTVPSASVRIGITVTFMFHSFFSSQARSRYLTLYGSPGQQSPLFGRFSLIFSLFSFFFFFFFVVDYHSVWSSGRDQGIRLYLKIPEEFVHFPG